MDGEWKIMENPSMIWGYPHFRKPPYGYIVLYPLIKQISIMASACWWVLQVQSNRSSGHLEACWIWQGMLVGKEGSLSNWSLNAKKRQDGNHLDLSSDVDNTSNASKSISNSNMQNPPVSKKTWLGSRFAHRHVHSTLMALSSALLLGWRDHLCCTAILQHFGASGQVASG